MAFPLSFSKVTKLRASHGSHSQLFRGVASLGAALTVQISRGPVARRVRCSGSVAAECAAGLVLYPVAFFGVFGAQASSKNAKSGRRIQIENEVSRPNLKFFFANFGDLKKTDAK